MRKERKHYTAEEKVAKTSAPPGTAPSEHLSSAQKL
jgi:hypothetical protein